MPVLIHHSAAAQQAGVLTCRQGGRGLAGKDGVGLVPNEEPRSGGEVCFSTMHPRMATLRPGIGDMREAHLLNSLREFRAGQQCQAQLLPILALATRDHIANGRKVQPPPVKPKTSLCQELTTKSPQRSCSRANQTGRVVLKEPEGQPAERGGDRS